MPVLGWVGIGCGTVIVIGVVVVSLLVGFCKRKVGEFTRNPEKAGAELMVKMNPGLELVSQDDAKGEMTIRTKDGQEMTMNYQDIAAGKFTVKDADGTTTQIGQADLSTVPAWVPRVPKLQSTTSSVQNKASGKISGLYAATTTESIGALEAFFKAEAEKLKMTSSSRTALKADGVENRMLSYEGEGRTLNIVITSKPGEDGQVNVGYEEEP